MGTKRLSVLPPLNMVIPSIEGEEEAEVEVEEEGTG